MLLPQSSGVGRVVRRRKRFLRIENLEAREVPAAFTPGNLAVVRMGDGSAALGNTGTAVFIDEYAPTGTAVHAGNTTATGNPLPTTVAGSNVRLVDSGSAASDGQLTRSNDGQYLILTGYDAALATASVASAAGIDRVVGRVDAGGAIDTTTHFNDGYTGNNIRSVASVDGSAFWTSGAGTGGGVRYLPFGATTSTQISSTVANTRAITIANNQLYVSSASGAFQGLSAVGSGLPTTAGQTITALPGFPTASGPSSYQFAFKDANTVYVADDRTTVAGGIQKWTLGGGTWSLAYTLSPGTGLGARGLVGDFSGTSPVLYATTTEASANKLVKVTDTGAGSAFSVLATAPTNTAFRGVAFAPAAAGSANQPPVNTLPASVSASEDLLTPIAGVSVADPDAAATNIQVTLSVPTGSLLVADAVTGGLTAAQIGGNNTGTVVLTAPQAAINVTLANATGLQFTTATNAAANVVLTMTTDDLGNTGTGGAKSDTDTLTIGVVAVNDAPTLDALSPVAVDEDAGEQTINLAGIGAGGGADEAGQTLTITATSDNPTLIGDPTVQYTAGDPAGTLRFTPAANAFGTATISVRINDGAGTANGGVEEVVRTFTVTVNPINDAPVVTGGTFAVNQGAAVDTLVGTPLAFTDVENNAVTWAITAGNTGNAFTIDATGQIKVLTPAAVSNGPFTLTVEALDDGTPTPAAGTATVTININTAPTGDIPDTTATEDGPDIVLNLADYFADAETLPADLTYTLVGTLPGVFSSAVITGGALTLDLAADANTDGTLTVRATDPQGLFVEDSFTVGLTAVNDAPTLAAISDLPLAEDAGEQTISLSGISAGAANEAQTLTVTAVSDDPTKIPTPLGVYTSPDSTGELKFTPAANATGIVKITVTLSDDSTAGGAARTTTREFFVTLAPVADTPGVTPATTFEDTQSTTGLVISPNAADGSEVTHFKVTALSTGSLFLADGTTAVPNGTFLTRADAAAGLKYTPPANFNGTATFQVRASQSADDSGLGGPPATATITVTSVNDLPVVSGGPFAIRQDSANGSVVGTIAAADVENQTPFVFAITGRNTGTAFAIDSATGQITVANRDAITNFYDLTVSATDTGGGVGTATVRINLDFAPTTSGIPNQTKPEDAGPFDVDLAAAFADVETPDGALVFAVVGNTNPALFSSTTISGTTLTLTPAPDANGVSTLTIRATDEQGQLIETAFQVTLGPVNDGPLLNTAPKVALTAVAAKATNPPGDPVSRLTANVTDADGESQGVAITAFTQGANGVWQFSLDDGTNWLAVPANVAVDRALLLPDTARVRFLPAKKFQGFAFLSYKAWDQSTGTVATQADTAAGSAFSAATETAVVAVGKTSPRIDAAGNPLLSNVAEDAKLPKGDAVSTLLGALATDANAKTKFGMAVTGLTGTADGTWQYSLGGNRWSPVGIVGDTAALLLAPANKLRFVPNADFSGPATVTYRAWDQTAGSAGARTPIAGSAFSLAAETAVVNVTPVNDAPVLDRTRARTLPAVAGGATTTPITVTSLIAGAVTDVDSPIAGIVVVGASGQGQWKFKTGAGAFTVVPKVSANKGLLLTGADQLEFVADAGFTGSAGLSYRAWDGSAGTAGQVVSTKGTAFSVGTEVLTVAAAGNVATDISTPAILPAIAEDTAAPAGATLATVLPKGSKGVAITGATTTDGKWQYALTPNAWVDVGTATPANAVLLPAAARVRFVPNANFNGPETFQFQAWDLTTGQAGDRFDTTQAGLVSFGATTTTATIQVSSLNDSPVLDTTPVKVLDQLTGPETTPVSVATLLGANVTDADGTLGFGLAITAATGPGIWRFSTDGTNFNSFPVVSAAKPLFLQPTDLVKFVATGNGGASLSYKAWDQSTEAGAATTSAATETLTFAVGTAAQPTIGSTATLTTIAEDPKTVLGDEVGTAFGRGVALTALTGMPGGKWQYSLTTNVWVDVGTVSDTAALVLPAAARLRFLPDADFNGSAAVTAKGWDGFTGAAGEKVDTLAVGTANSFSPTTATGTVSVLAVNDAPVLDTAPAPTLPDLPVNPPAADTGATVASLLGGAATDVEGATLGVALVGAAGKGMWQYSRDGGTTWTTVKPSTAKAVLLDAAARVRFVPTAGVVGKATLSFRAWEVTAGQIGTTAAVSGSAFSVATETATVSVGNSGPVLMAL